LLKQNYLPVKKRFKEIVAAEISEATFQSMRQNCMDLPITVLNADFFEFPADRFNHPKSKETVVDSGPAKSPLWIIVNPPYGTRLSQNATILQILKKAQALGASKIGVLFPENFESENFQGWTLKASHPVSNGGLRTYFSVWTQAEDKTQHR
jgi:predicted RNA methylase